jgi:hypothetical protein
MRPKGNREPFAACYTVPHNTPVEEVAAMMWRTGATALRLVQRELHTFKALTNFPVTSDTSLERQGGVIIPSDRRLSAKAVPTFADRRCHVVSMTDPCGRILGF